MARFSLAVALVAMAALAAASPLDPCKTAFDESIAINNANCSVFETLAECLILTVDAGKSSHRAHSQTHQPTYLFATEPASEFDELVAEADSIVKAAILHTKHKCDLNTRKQWIGSTYLGFTRLTSSLPVIPQSHSALDRLV